MGDSCFHGGRFHVALGNQFETLDRLGEIVPADVLDAWFPPPPSVLSALADAMPWLVKTSPPLNAEPLAKALGDFLQVDEESILPGAGSSALIFLALSRWLTPYSRVILPDPGYGEYRHVGNLAGARPDRIALWPGDGIEPLRAALCGDYDLVVIVNPNNPTGWTASTPDLIRLLEERAPRTKVWVDEAYASYVPEIGTLTGWAATQRGVFVSRTLSKSHALSGLRAACLVGHPDELAKLRPYMPPWSVSFPAQVAAIQALKEQDYYQEKYIETIRLREDMAASLSKGGMEILACEANWILARHNNAAKLIEQAEAQGIYLRDPTNMSSEPWPDTLRIAVRSPEESHRIKTSLAEMMAERLVSSSAPPAIHR